MREGMRIFVRGIREASRAGGAKPEAGTGAIPRLVAESWLKDLLAGYRDDPARILKPLPAGRSEDLVAARDIEFTSVCRHHLLPFSGRAHLAYAPRGSLAGFSSLGRLVDCLSRRLQLQEDLTRQVADALQRHLDPAGAVCVLEASHTCVTMRGARKTRSRVVTVAFTGRFRRAGAARREALALLGYPPQSGRLVIVNR